MKRQMLAGAVCLLLTATSGLAADANNAAPVPDKGLSGNQATANEPCQAEPQGNAAGNADQPRGNTATTATDDATLTAKLDKCNSVLNPPNAGDSEMVEPAPDVGRMPVIPPKAVPDQSQSDEEH